MKETMQVGMVEKRIGMTGLKGIFEAEKAVWIRKSRAAVLTGCLLLAACAFGGCGQKVQEAITEIPEIEENSLAQWKASLEEGEIDELSAESIRGVSVVRDGKPLFAVSYEPRTYKNTFDCWAISEPYQSMVVVDTEAMYDYFHVLAEMELTPAGDVTKEQAGVTDSSNTIYVAYYKDQTPEGGQAAPDRSISYRFGGQDSAGDYYVEADGAVWTVSAETVEKLFTVNPYDCILKIVGVVGVDTISKVEVMFGDKTHEMEIKEEKFKIDGKTVDDTRFNELYTELMSIFIEKELLEAVGTDGERELLMTVVYHRNTSQAPRIIQRYYVYDENYASVQVNGTEFFLVSREAVERLGEMFEG